MTQTLRIGTRGSKLALIQARIVCDALKKAHPDLETAIVEIKTSGDWKPQDGETRLSEEKGGKGLFAKEIEEALQENIVDCGVHSMKDMDSFLPDGLVIDHMFPRENPLDSFISSNSRTIDELPDGATVGTSSVRRQAFLLARRPDLKIVPFRGNVPTRLEKLRNGQVDATILAVAGLNRLGLQHEMASVISADVMLPAAGQGAVGIEIRKDDERVRALFDAVNCRDTVLRVKAERAALQVLDGSCHTPIGALATLSGREMSIRLAVASLDGQDIFEESANSAVKDIDEAIVLGQKAGDRLKARLPEGFLA